MNSDKIKTHLKKTGLVSTTGLKKRELEILRYKVSQYTASLKNNNTYKTVKFGTKKPINLSDAQIAIVKADVNSHYKIIACAGSGKTTTIICRIKYLIDSGVKPYSIMLTTFNVDAAENMKTKLNELFGFNLNIYVGTIDALAYRFYNAYFKRTDFIGVSEYCTEFLKFLKSDLDKSEKLRNKFKYIFFDEFQDCNDVQYEIVKIFAQRSWVTVIGDDAQNIYQWRGSNMDFILRFEDYLPIKNNSSEIVNVDKTNSQCKIMTLVQNFRSTPEIIEFANRSIEKNSDQILKKMVAGIQISRSRLPKVSVYNSVDEEASYIIASIQRYMHEGGIKAEDIAVLARNNYSIKKIEELIEINNSTSDNENIGYVALITDDIRDTKPKILKGHITLTTIHKAKGLEWDVVFVMSCNDDKFPSEISSIKLQEERRLFYVAITRAKRYLNISFIANKNVTRFIGELDAKLYDFKDIDECYFKYDNFDVRNIKFKNGVTQLIEMLEPMDILKLRDLGYIPEINPIIRNVHSEHKYSDYISTYYLQADYGTYIDRYISRQLGVSNPLSGGLLDSTANRVLHSLKLDVKFYDLYMKYNYNILRKIDSVISIPTIATTVDAIIGMVDKTNSDPKYIKHIEKMDYDDLASLITSMITKADTIKCTPSQIFITPISYLPHAFYKEYYESYERFQSRVSGNIILKDIYRVSLCQNVYDGRRRLLYKDCFDEFNTDTKLYNDINNWCCSYNSSDTSDIKTKVSYSDTDLSICGELDMLVTIDGTERIIDFKCSISSECKLEWIIQLLMYAALHRKKTGRIINAISIYNPLKGLMIDVNIGSWNMHNELLAFMDGIRTERMSRR